MMFLGMNLLAYPFWGALNFMHLQVFAFHQSGKLLAIVFSGTPMI